MFIGNFPHTLDDKGRLIMPSKFRKELGSNFFVTRGFNKGCLVVYTEEKWYDLREELKNSGLSGSEIAKLTRYLYSNAVNLDLDKQGRFLISKELREKAGIEKDVIILGISDKIEIWAKDNWDQYEEEINNDVEEMSEIFDKIGF